MNHAHPRVESRLSPNASEVAQAQPGEEGDELSVLEIKPHAWIENGQRCRADFYPFVDGEPAPALADCGLCEHFVEGEDCAPSKDPDEPLSYPFCGPICGAFKPKPGVLP